MLEKKLNDDVKQAMKDKDEAKLSILRMVRSSIQNYKIEKKKEELKDEDVITILSKHAKQANDSLEGFKKGGREDLVKKEEAELAIIKSYLPEELAEAELKKIIDEAVQKTGASKPQDMGRVMKEIMPKTKGRADGKLVSQMVQAALKSS